MPRFFIHFITIVWLVVSTVGSVHVQALATGIRVLVYGVHYGGNMVYSYKVINNGDTPFNNFTIGSYFKSEEDGELPQLIRLPLGWSYGRTGETGTAIILAPASTSQPPYWTPHVFGQQENDNYYLKWHASRGPGDVSNSIRPGQTLAGFSVTVPLVDNSLDLPAVTGQPVFTGSDEMYIKGGFKVGYYPEKQYQEVWGTLEREDTTPPNLTVSLSPTILWPPNEKLVPVTATITVKDDYDPEPEIKLESITASEALADADIQNALLGTDDRSFSLAAERAGTNQAGRIYTVTYSATDASGNKVTASATVTVPHDQGK
jgi:hypothetical protein